MRRILALILVLITLLGLCACDKNHTDIINSSNSDPTGIDKPTDVTEVTQIPTDELPSIPTETPTTPSADKPADDVSAPVVESVTIDKTSATIGDVVTVTMKISDESDISSCRVTFHMSNGQMGNAWTDLKKDSDGLFRGTIKIDSTFVAGKCTLNWFQVDDIFSNSLLVSDGYDDFYFNVTGASTDTTAPVVESFTIDKTSATIGDVVTVTMKISDESDISSCRVAFHMSNGQTGNAWTDLKKDSDGLFRGTIKIDSTFVAGKCTLNWFQVDDMFSNSLLVSSGYDEVCFEVS